MAYHPLANDTGGTADDRRAEAARILKIFVENDLHAAGLTEREARFVAEMLDDPTQNVSPKQLFWLRDLKDKYL